MVIKEMLGDQDNIWWWRECLVIKKMEEVLDDERDVGLWCWMKCFVMEELSGDGGSAWEWYG